MSLYQFKQKISYRLHALNRHGVHSPFVFDFVEQVLNGKYKAELELILPDILPLQLNDKSRLLLRHLIHYYHCRKLIVWDNKQAQEYVIQSEQILAASFDQLMLVNDVLQFSPDRLASIETNSIVAVTGIYNSEAHTNTWRSLCKDSAVTLSIDVFEAGLLFFRKDFLVKQHFRLKYQ